MTKPVPLAAIAKCCASSIALLALAGCGKPDLFAGQKAAVVAIPSANTLVVVSQGKEHSLRLCGVEVAAAQAAQAKQLLQRLVDRADGWAVVLPVQMKGGDIVAEVNVPTPSPSQPEEEKSLNGELLLAGLAKLSTNPNCSSNQSAFQSAQEDAQERRVGIWSQTR